MASDSRQTSVVHFLNGETTTTPAPKKSVSERDDAMLTLDFVRAPLHHPSVIYLVMLNSSTFANSNRVFLSEQILFATTKPLTTNLKIYLVQLFSM